MKRHESPKRGGLSRARLIGARALTVLAILLALVGMLAFYVAHTALDEDGVRDGLAQHDRERRDPDAGCGHRGGQRCTPTSTWKRRSRSGCLPAQQGLAPVLAGLSRSGADRAAEAALERPRVQTVWVETTTATQRQLVRLLDDKTRFESEGGKVVLDLRPIIIQIGDQVAVIGRVAEKLPESAGQDHDHRREPAGDGPDDHADPARGRQLDVARRDRGRGTRDLAGARTSQDRTPRARDRRARSLGS